MIKSVLFVFIFFAASIAIDAQDSLQVFIISIDGDTSTHVFSKKSESSSLLFKRKTEQMHFAEATPMQLFDTYGNKIKSVKSTELNLSNVKKGIYYVKFFNRNEEEWLTVKVLVK